MARRSNDPFGNYRFIVELDSVQVAGFAECTGLQIETKVFEYQEGGRNETSLKFPQTSTYSNITLKRGVTTSNALIDWQLDVVRGTFRTNARNPRPQSTPPLAIILLDEQGTAAKRWNLIRAFPVKWIGPDLKAMGNEVAIETLELTHEGIERG
ncbi:MAG TPA: phage tail protein [Candidatus Entotheonella sp.]|jgi:phage tail-like protein